MFFNSRPNLGIMSVQCFPSPALIQQNNDLMYFYQIDNKVNSYLLFIHLNKLPVTV